LADCPLQSRDQRSRRREAPGSPMRDRWSRLCRETSHINPFNGNPAGENVIGRRIVEGRCAAVESFD